MPQAIPEKYKDLFQKRAFASLGTLMPDGRPQVTPVWCDLDGDHVIFNSAKGRQKDRNVRRDPRVSLAIVDPENPYRYLEIRGRVVEITEDGADDRGPETASTSWRKNISASTNIPTPSPARSASSTKSSPSTPR